MKLNAKELRTFEPDPVVIQTMSKKPIYIVLDNVLDTYNVGSIFRLADAVSAKEVILCGQTETPPNTRIKKASINTWQWVTWRYEETAIGAVQKLKMQNARPKADQPLAEKLQIVALEQDKRSIPLKDFRPEFPLVVVVGNETYGVSKAVLEMSDTVVELPMFGVNTSLNVMVSCGIFLYKCLEYL